MGGLSQRFDVVVVGGGVGGLCAAVELQGRGVNVCVVERHAEVGGKLRVAEVAGHTIDVGPTVLTLTSVFDELFAAAGLRRENFIGLQPLSRLARHAWTDGSRLDLFADLDQSITAVREFAGPTEADGFVKFMRHAHNLLERAREPFLAAERPSLWGTIRHAGVAAAGQLLAIDWHRSLARLLRSFFGDPRLHQLFGRYATYCGSSPFRAPATLALIAAVEQRGVWAVDGGMIELARGLRRALEALGGTVITGNGVDEVRIHHDVVRGVTLTDGYRIDAQGVVVNADPAATARGALGSAAARVVPTGGPRSLSAMTWALVANRRRLPARPPQRVLQRRRTGRVRLPV